MKSKVILALMVAGTMALTSCTRKIDEKTMADINQFGTDWTNLGEKATNWANDLSASTQQVRDFAAKQKTMMDNMANSKDEVMKTKSTEMYNNANENATQLEAMLTEWNTFKTSWDENTKAYSEWKDKVSKGEVNSDDAVKGLNDWKAKMTEAQTQIDGWNTTYASIKESTSKNMASADEIEKNISSTTNTNKGTTGTSTSNKTTK